jgi:hypothetical protein
MDEDSFEPPCFDAANVASCLELFPQEGEVLPVEIAQASSVGVDAHFAKLGGWAALAELPVGQAPRVVLADVGSRATILEVDVMHPDGTLDILAVWGEREIYVIDALQSVAVALGCTDAGCELLSAASGDETLEVVPGYALDPAARVDHLAGGWGKLCAYGEGLFCLDGATWTNAIPAEVSGRIVSVSLGYPSVAVTAQGELFIEAETGDWVLKPSPIESGARVEASDGTVSLVDDGGAWTILSLDPPATASCQQTPRLVTANPGSSRFGIPWLVADEDASVFRQRQTYEAPNQPRAELTWCRVSNAAPASAVIDVDAIRCADGTNLLGITSGQFFSLNGAIACPLT